MRRGTRAWAALAAGMALACGAGFAAAQSAPSTAAKPGTSATATAKATLVAGDATASWQRARALADADRHDEALAVIAAALDKHPDDISLLWLRAGVTGWAGRHRESVALFEALLARHPEMTASVRADLATQRLWAGDPEGAIRDFDERLEERPEDDASDRLRARAYADAGRLDESIAAYERLLRAHPGDVDLMLGRARALGWTDRHVPAIAAYREVLERDPGNMDARLGIATNENWRGRHRQAAALFAEIARDSSADPEALKGLAYAEYWAGRPDKAFAPLERYVTMAPDDPEGTELARMLARETHPGLTGGYDWSGDSDDLHVFTTTLEYRLTADPRTAVSIGWRRDRVSDGGGREEPSRLGIGVQRIWSDLLSTRAYLWGFKPGPGRTERGMGEAEVSLRPGDALSLSAGYTKEPVLTRLSLERRIDMRSVSLGAEWLATPRLTLEGSHQIARYSDHNRALRTSAGAAFTVVKRRRFAAAVTGDVEHLRVRDDLDNGYYDPERYYTAGPGVRLEWTPREAASIELIARAGVQEEKDADAEPYHNVRLSVDVPLGWIGLFTEFETSDSNLSSATGFEQQRWAAYLSVPF